VVSLRHCAEAKGVYNIHSFVEKFYKRVMYVCAPRESRVTGAMKLAKSPVLEPGLRPRPQVGTTRKRTRR
jgi:hypothetical protein